MTSTSTSGRGVARGLPIPLIALAAAAAFAAPADAATPVDDAAHRVSFEESALETGRTTTIVFSGVSTTVPTQGDAVSGVAILPGAQSVCPSSFAVANDRAVENVRWSAGSPEHDYLAGGGAYTVKGTLRLDTAGTYTACGYTGEDDVLAFFNQDPEQTKEQYAPVVFAVADPGATPDGAGTPAVTGPGGSAAPPTSPPSTQPKAGPITATVRGRRKAARTVTATLSRRAATDGATYRVALTRGGRRVAVGTVRGRTLKVTVQRRAGRLPRLAGTYGLRSPTGATQLPAASVRIR